MFSSQNSFHVICAEYCIFKHGSSPFISTCSCACANNCNALHRATPMEYRSLGNTGLQLSLIGLGGSGYGGLYGEYDEEEAARTLRLAIQRGINYIDTSPFYGEGRSEEFIGRALKGVPRDQYFIGTKVGRYFWEVSKRFDFSAERVTKSIEESLKRLQLDYLDILQVHDLEFAPSLDLIINETLPAIQQLKEKGLCRFIGITGYPLEPLKQVVSCSTVKIDCVLSYCRLTLNDDSLTNDFDFFKSHGVAVINASPLSMGMLTEAGPQKWNPAQSDVKDACKRAVEYCRENGVDITRLAVKYSTSFKEVTTTLIAFKDMSMLEKNISSALTPLTEKEKQVMTEIKRMFFEPLPKKHWEGISVEQYKKELAELNGSLN